MDITKEYLTKMLACQKHILVIYVLDAQYMGITDDQKFLQYVAELKRRKDFPLVFALNKVDCADNYDGEQSDIEISCKKYLQDNGIKNPLVFSLSAYSALLFKKILKQEKLREAEEDELPRIYKIFRTKNKRYAYLSNVFKGRVLIGDRFYGISDIKSATYSTGLAELVNYIHSAM